MSHVAHGRVCGEALGSFLMLSLNSLNGCLARLLLQQLETCQTGRTSDWIAGELVSMKQGARFVVRKKCVVDPFVATGGAKWQRTSGQSFGKTDQIRL